MTYRFRVNDLRITENKAGNVVYFLVEDLDTGVKHRLYDKEFRVAQLFDGKRTVEKVAKLTQKKLGLGAEVVDVQSFAQQLLALGFVEQLS